MSLAKETRKKNTSAQHDYTTIVDLPDDVLNDVTGGNAIKDAIDVLSQKIEQSIKIITK